MKVYSIKSPDVLERAADVTKWQSHRIQVMNYLAYWKRRLEQDPADPLPPVTLELGRQAQLFRHDGGKKQLLATMIVIGARQFVEREGMVAEK